MTAGAVADPWGTAALRSRVLAAWTASPARFREDANAEEDYALGAYRDRLVVELAQNAADAAARAGAPGALRLSLAPDDSAGSGWTLVAANTGAPLDGDGVEALSTLRASAKRDDDPAAIVGRYGVGFAAVLDVTDHPAVRSTSGGVQWSREGTRAQAVAVPVLTAELDARAGHVPVLRLPWPDPAPPPAGFDTAVVLPLRDDRALERVRGALAELDAAVLLMLPALAEVSVDDGSGSAPRVLGATDLHVRTVQAGGPVDPGLLADRPVEERRLRSWTVRWASPRPAGAAAVLHAPTPTDEPVDLPALLIASFPLEPGRRHVAAGALRDALVEHAAQAYADLVRAVARGEPDDRADGVPDGIEGSPDDVLRLVPGPVAVGPLDADLRRAILDRLRVAPVLPGGLRPDEAVAVDGLAEPVASVLAEVMPGLLAPAWAGRREVDRLGVRRLRLGDVVDELYSLDRPASWWRALYEALDAAGSVDLDELSGLPVPLADGRLVRGPRGAVVDVPPELADAMAVLGLRVVDPAAAAPLLARLGAVAAAPRTLLAEPAVRSAVEQSLESEDPGPVAAAVLSLVRAAGIGPGELPWLGALALADDEGGYGAAGELLLPGGALASVLTSGALGCVDPGLVAEWGEDALAATGALGTFALVRDEDVPLDVDGCDHDLDGEDAWVEEALDRLPRAVQGDLPPVLPEYVAVRDLDLVAADRWPQALRLVAGDQTLRAAVVEPARVLLQDGRVAPVESYAAWWLRTHPVMDGQRPDELRAPGTAGLAGLLPAAPDLGLDDAFLRAVGVVTSVADIASSPMVLPLLRAGADAGPDAVPDRAGAQRPVPEVVAAVLVDARRALPATYTEHDDLTVGGVRVDWWVTEPGHVHAATLDGLARALAWAAGRWERRWLLAAVLAEPDRAEELLAEDGWGPDA